MSHLYTTRNPQPSARRQQVHGWLQPLEDDTLWSSIRTGLISANIAVWGVAGAIFLIVSGGVK